MKSSTSLGNDSCGLSLVVRGDEEKGYSSIILYDGKPVGSHGDGGEFVAVLENGDHSIRCQLDNWRAKSFSQNGNTVQLTGTTYLDELNTVIDVKVIYTAVNAHVIKKQIVLEQQSASKLYYSIQNRLRPKATPSSYWTFENEDYPGGSVFEIYPAAGFRTQDGLAVGLLTDSGYRNLWTKNNRRRTLKGGMMGLEVIPDTDLVRVCDQEERDAGNSYVELNFGTLHDFRIGQPEPIVLPEVGRWGQHNGGYLKESDTENRGSFRIAGRAPGVALSGITIPLEVRAGLLYTVRFRYRSSFPDVGIHVWDTSDTRQTAFNLVDNFNNASPDQWQETVRSFYLTENVDKIHLYIGKGTDESNQPIDYWIEVQNLQILAREPVVQAYHPIEAGRPVEKTIFIFAEQAETLEQLRRASQVRLAEGLGCTGSQEEKIFYADRQMLMWIPEPGDFTPHNVPSLGYSPDMYFRDSFWIVVAGYDRELNEGIYEKWAITQNDDGCIRTILTPYVGDQEHSPNESTMLFIIWSYVNKKRFSSNIKTEVVQRAVDYCRTTFDPDRTGSLRAPTPAWMDVIWPEGKFQFAVMQGIYANALRCAWALGCDVTEDEVRAAAAAYQSLYDPELGYVAFADRAYEFYDAISPSSLMGEFLSLWLWDEPILSDEAVIGTLERLPEYDGCVPCICAADGSFFDLKTSPFTPENRWDEGVYINGGSWMLYEYLAYVAGLRHGWKKAEVRMKKRVEAEFTFYPGEPFSHEHLALRFGEDGRRIPCYHRVFGWNAFMLIANEVAGLRKREQDPSYEPTV